MSEASQCPKCGATFDNYSYRLVGDSTQLLYWKCGTREHVNGNLMCGDECYRRQLAALTAALAERDAEIERLREVANWAQAVLTGLNVGDVKSGSPLHLKLREVMIAYREQAALAPAPPETQA